uniref:Histone H2A/H2B/H3 domain-containing protein n=1 Tax=Panagrolaimus davidi TaxID=227884 RepID=A0A914QK00_9BILA
MVRPAETAPKTVRNKPSAIARKSIRPDANSSDSGGVDRNDESRDLARKSHRETNAKGSSRRKGAKPVKNNKSAAERLALKTVRRKSDYLIPRAPFFKVVKQVMSDFAPAGSAAGERYKIQRAALDALQMSAEAYLVNLFEDMNILTMHGKRYYRHGQRSPTSFLIFPTDDPHFLDNYDAEPGELTIYGIRQEFELGLTLRKQYNSFLGDKYRSRESLILAGKDNRTIVSALSVLAALYPPKEKQIWMEGFHWQPIPVHSEELLDDVCIFF